MPANRWGGKAQFVWVQDPYVDSHHLTAGQGPRAVDKLYNLSAGNGEGLIISQQVELARTGTVLLQQDSTVVFGAPFGRMEASGVLAVKSLRPELLGVPAVHASPLTDKGLQGTTVHLRPEQGSGKEFLPMIDGCSEHGLGIGDHSGNVPQTEAKQRDHDALGNGFDGLSREPPSLSQEGKTLLVQQATRGSKYAPKEPIIWQRPQKEY